MYVYKNREYSTLGAVAKAMGINRSVLVYRHRTLGIPLEKVLDYKPRPLPKAVKSKHPKPSINELLAAIVTAPPMPSWRELQPNSLKEGTDYEQIEQGKKRVIKWAEQSPVPLIERAIMLVQRTLTSPFARDGYLEDDDKASMELFVALLAKHLEKTPQDIWEKYRASVSLRKTVQNHQN